MKKAKGNIGPLVIELEGTGKLFDRFCDEIDLKSSIRANEEVDLKVVLDDFSNDMNSYTPMYSSAKQHMTFNDTTFYYDQPVPFLCKNLFSEGTCELRISNSPQTDVKSLLKKLTSISINSHSELSYSLFWYVIQVLLLKNDCSFIHAGVLTNKTEAFAFMGTGGSGKTSTMFHLLDNPKFSYLSEDFGIISKSGQVFLSPKTLSIYDSDIQNGSNILQSAKNKLTKVEKLRWLIYKYAFQKNPMKKIPISSFFNEEKLGNTSDLHKAFYIVRTNNDLPSVHKIDNEEMAKRLVSVTLREMKKLVELLNLITANAPERFSLLNVNQFIENTMNVYKEAFKEADLFLLELPFKASPAEVEDFLKSKHLID